VNKKKSGTTVRGPRYKVKGTRLKVKGVGCKVQGTMVYGPRCTVHGAEGTRIGTDSGIFIVPDNTGESDPAKPAQALLDSDAFRPFVTTLGLLKKPHKSRLKIISVLDVQI
jgi:hypothetical protein